MFLRWLGWQCKEKRHEYICPKFFFKSSSSKLSLHNTFSLIGFCFLLQFQSKITLLKALFPGKSRTSRVGTAIQAGRMMTKRKLVGSFAIAFFLFASKFLLCTEVQTAYPNASLRLNICTYFVLVCSFSNVLTPFSHSQ